MKPTKRETVFSRSFGKGATMLGIHAQCVLTGIERGQSGLRDAA